MVFDTLREFGVSVYAQEDGPKNGNYAPSFHIIDHVIYHTSLDTPDWCRRPAWNAPPAHSPRRSIGRTR